jgi:hypothetical protein
MIKNSLKQDSLNNLNEEEDVDGEPNFIKKEDNFVQKEDQKKDLNSVFDGLKQDLQKGINNIKSIFPLNNKQRNLSEEVGGLEQKKIRLTKESKEDLWDKRSEEVDKMGSTNTFETTGMRSVIGKLKRKMKIKSSNSANSTNQKDSYLQKIKGFKKDKYNQKNDGAWR